MCQINPNQPHPGPYNPTHTISSVRDTAAGKPEGHSIDDWVDCEISVIMKPPDLRKEKSPSPRFLFVRCGLAYYGLLRMLGNPDDLVELTKSQDKSDTV